VTRELASCKLNHSGSLTIKYWDCRLSWLVLNNKDKTMFYIAITVPNRNNYTTAISFEIIPSDEKSLTGELNIAYSNQWNALQAARKMQKANPGITYVVIQQLEKA